MSTTYESLDPIDVDDVDDVDDVEDVEWRAGDLDDTRVPIVRGRAPSRRARRVSRVWRGHPADPSWARPALIGLLGLTAVLYLWGLGASGWANAYYAAAVQAGTKSWKAFLFGSTDASNFITVDKTPASLWPMEISARLFGVNPWSLLVPQALEGVATVALLYAAVKRWFGAGAGLLAGVVVASTPVAALMFRFDNPDALLTLCIVAAAWAITRALDDGRTRWLVLCGAFLGFGFLAKELQVFLVAPGIGLAYLFAGPPKLGRRVVQLIALVASLLAAAGWWVAIVQLTPASSRPYIGGSQDNSFWNVLFGYNGFGRLTGNETGSVGGQSAGVGGVGGGPSWGPTGWYRMFNVQFGTQISWLLPAALVLLVAGMVWSARRARTDRLRAALVVWGGWLVVTTVAFSFGRGIIHEYYTVALAPALGAIVGIVGTQLWHQRAAWFARVSLAAALAATMWWTGRLLARVPSWFARLHTPLVGAGFALALALAWTTTGAGRRRWVATAVATGALVVGLAAPAAATITTVTTPHRGAIPLAGPATTGTGRSGFPGGLRFSGTNGAHRQRMANGGGFGGPPFGFNPFGTALAPGAPFTLPNG